MTVYNRDCFAREDYVKQKIFVSDKETCAWCGSVKQSKTGFKRKYLFRYGTQPDSISGKVYWQKELFCCVDCMRIYNS